MVIHDLDEFFGYPHDLGNNKYTDVTINNNDLLGGSSHLVSEL